MATDISKSASGVIAVTVDTAPARVYVRNQPIYSFNAVGDILNISFGLGNSYAIPIANLTIQGAPVASAAAGYTALVTVFT